MPEGDSLHSLRELITSAGRGLGLADAVATGRLWARWADIVGRGVADHAEPTSLRAGVLRVRTDSPAWATEISYLGEEIRRRSNDALGRPLVTEVRVWTAPRRVGKEGGSRPVPAPRPDHPAAAPTGDPEVALRRARAAWERRRGTSRQRPQSG